MNTIPTTVATSMPLNTVVPMMRRLWAPAPVASIIGRTPIMNDTAVIITARKRRDALPCGIDNRHSVHAPGAGKLHNKNCVLGGEGYQ